MTSPTTQYAVGVFLAFHGAIHGWYVVLSRGWIAAEGEQDWGWNGRSWLLSGLLSRAVVLDVASVLYGLVAAGFVVGALGYLRAAAWSGPVLVAAAVLSAVVIVAFWDGTLEQLPEKGVLGLLIDAAVVTWLVVV